MIGQRVPELTGPEKRKQYDLATERDPNCVRCERPSQERDHRQNRQRGNTVVANLQGFCKPCHEWKTTHSKDAMVEGFAVSRYADFRKQPARRMHKGHLIWVLYDDAGGWEKYIPAEAKQLLEG